jgi:hypothetical protein
MYLFSLSLSLSPEVRERFYPPVLSKQGSRIRSLLPAPRHKGEIISPLFSGKRGCIISCSSGQEGWDIFIISSLCGGWGGGGVGRYLLLVSLRRLEGVLSCFLGVGEGMLSLSPGTGWRYLPLPPVQGVS